VFLKLCCLTMGTCLPTRCLEMLWYARISHDHCIATAIRAAIFIWLLVRVSGFVNDKLGKETYYSGRFPSWLLLGLTIKFANSPPCACCNSSGQKPQYGLMTLAY
jgi:hypothetical protein